MIWLARCLAVFTMLLGLATMAVSAYAARQDGGALRHLVTQPENLRSTVPAVSAITSADEVGTDAWDIAVTAMVVGLSQDRGPGSDAVSFIAPTPTTEIHYAAPVGAAGVTGTQSGRDDLSPGPSVGSAVSIKPILANIFELSRGGLDIPPGQLAVMQQVGNATGIPWQVLAAIAKVESDLGRNMATSSAGAIGYGQFLPGMWEVYGNGGDPYDYHDVIPAMGRYLLDHGAPQDIRGALFAYNHSWPYVGLVLSYASAYGYQRPGSTDGLIWPAIGPISSHMGPDHPLGIDVDLTASPEAPVVAAHDGVVLFAGGDPCCSYGYYVVLVGPSGLVTLYGHFDHLLVHSGDTVRQAQPLGTAGCTGICTGTHLHLEVIEDGVRRNPLEYLP